MTKRRACEFRRDHRHLWVVVAREGFHDPTKDMRWIPTASSSVYCPGCGNVWRTTALYVEELPDADRSQREQLPRTARIADLVAEYPLLAELTYLNSGGHVEHNRFLTDLAKQLTYWGTLTPRQIAGAEGALQRLISQQGERDRIEAEERAKQGTNLAPRGRTDITGRVLDVWTDDPDSNPDVAYRRTRMTVLADEGYEVECTVPRVLLTEVGEQINGRRIWFTAELKPKWGEPTKAWGSWPGKKAVLFDEEVS